MTKPRPCARCGVNPIAYYGRKYCYDCVPRVWKRPVRCKRCGSDTDYYTNGLCRRCHRSAPLVTSCRDCLAWGITRHHGGLCQGCRSWNQRFGAPQECPSCRRTVIVNARGYCRLCCRQAHLVRPAHQSVDVCEANRYGQQLFIADLFRQKRPEPPPQPTRLTNWPTCYPVAHRQPVLFDAEHDYTTTRAFALTPPLPGLVDALEQVLVEHAAGHGWSQGLETNTRGALRILLATQDTPGAAIAASHAAAVSTGRRWNNFKSVLEILAQTGMLDDDRPDTLDGYFARHTAGLPEPMATEFGQWYHVLRHGRDTPPRYRPRSVPTTRIHILCAARMLHAWANAGHQSLREISRDDVLTTLPDKPYQRHRTLTALRFLFRFLKAHRIVFTDPTTRLRGDIVTGNQPLPTDLDRLREAVRSPQPVRAALAVLVAFHGLRNHELSTLLLTEIHDARLHQKRRTILLAEPVRAKLAAWLDERARRWPSTVNPHLFVNLHSAVHTGPVHREWITRTIGVSAQAIREDRILNEALTTGGDIRRLCDLFGLTIGGAERYIRGTEQPPLGSGTQAPT